MAKTKSWYAEQVLLELNSQLRNRDEKIDEREVFIRLDAIVNGMAKMGMFESWNMGVRHVGDQYTTTWDGFLNSWLSIVDPTEGESGESYIVIPSNYVELPKNAGIVLVYLEKEYFDPIAVLSSQEAVSIRNTLSGGLDGRLGVYPRGGRLNFLGRQDIGAKYGGAGLQLLIRDSSVIAADAPYPIDAGMENDVIQATVAWFRSRKAQGTDVVKDSVDEATRKIIPRSNG